MNKLNIIFFFSFLKFEKTEIEINSQFLFYIKFFRAYKNFKNKENGNPDDGSIKW